MDNRKQTQLLEYSACDISDALVHLGIANGGFLRDLHARNTPRPVLAPAFTVLFTPKSAAPAALPPANIPPAMHWVDMAERDSIVVIHQPPGQTNAVCGGIMALRMAVLGVAGVLVDGRVRDVQEFAALDVPILSTGTSTVGAGASSRAHSVQVPLDIDGTLVSPGDIIYIDPDNGVVCIPISMLDQVMELLPILKEADDKVKADVMAGLTVKEAFSRHRR
ncbi:hypothetical protein TD95_003078 [Thielaviopsis punctulata]|uniref:Uncharacterized protein n=1 Tax=Thielaviopsis punctulata TaxID=72032 RepID=A0A0F4ZEZ2_9PEZI|nr:hypothetical protein TD95_003078 [Thielaviopsis punctulata]